MKKNKRKKEKLMSNIYGVNADLVVIDEFGAGQLDLFSLPEEMPSIPVKVELVAAFSNKEFVKVKTITEEDYPDYEDYYYLKPFEGKKGHVTSIHYGKVISYLVSFGDKEGWFHEGDLINV